MQRSRSPIILRVYICTFGHNEFSHFLMTFLSSVMQKCSTTPYIIILRIYIDTVIQILFDDFNDSVFRSSDN